MPQITLACRNYDRTQAILRGLVKPKGVDLRVTEVSSPPELFTRVFWGEYEAGEMSLAELLIWAHILSTPLRTGPQPPPESRLVGTLDSPRNEFLDEVAEMGRPGSGACGWPFVFVGLKLGKVFSKKRIQLSGGIPDQRRCARADPGLMGMLGAHEAQSL